MSENNFNSMEFKSYQTGEIWTKPEPVKFVNIKPGKSNYHVRLVNEVVCSMYPHSNKVDMDAYDAHTEKAVRSFQKDYGYEITGVLTADQVGKIAEISGKFRLI